MIEIVVTIAAATISLVFGVLGALFITTRKKLRCIVVPTVSLVDVSEDIQDKTDISYNGKPVKNLSSTIVKIFNSGLFNISKDDFNQPLQIIFDKNISILECKTIKESRKGRKLKIKPKKNVCNINFDLLNKFDFFILQFIHEGHPDKKIPDVIADIKDIKEINTVDSTHKLCHL